jgi:hypothetical protein
MGPYGFGMYAAYVHLSGVNLLENSLSYLFEWISFLALLLIPFVHFIVPLWPRTANLAWLTFTWTVTERTFYGLALAYLLSLMLSVKPEESIPFYRPTCFLRAFYSMSIWVPIATLSYSFYLLHL